MQQWCEDGNKTFSTSYLTRISFLAEGADGVKSALVISKPAAKATCPGCRLCIRKVS